MNALLVAFAPIVWGTSYAVATEFLGDFDPFLVAALRALPAGVLLSLASRDRPRGVWWIRTFVLGSLNIGLFFGLLFFATYRLPGGIVATIGAIQPIIVLLLSWPLLDLLPSPRAVGFAIAGFLGVGLLLAPTGMAFDAAGTIAAFGAAVSMATGVVLTKRWGRPVSLIVFTGWQLIAGGIVLVAIVAATSPSLPSFDGGSVFGLAWLGVVGTALAYVIWFRGIATFTETWRVSILGLLSPLVAVTIGWSLLEQRLVPIQLVGAVTVGVSVAATQLHQNGRGKNRGTR